MGGKGRSETRGEAGERSHWGGCKFAYHGWLGEKGMERLVDGGWQLELTDRIGRIMEKHKLKIIYKPSTPLKDMLRSVKDSRDPLSTAGVYRIPCACGEVYIGTTQRSVKT